MSDQPTKDYVERQFIKRGPITYVDEKSLRQQEEMERAEEKNPPYDPHR